MKIKEFIGKKLHMCNTLVEVGRREGKLPVFLAFYFRFVSCNRINLHLKYTCQCNVLLFSGELFSQQSATWHE